MRYSVGLLFDEALGPCAGGEREAVVQLCADGVVVHVLTNEDELVLFGAIVPFAVIEGKALATEVEHMALLALFKPEDSFGAEDVF